MIIRYEFLGYGPRRKCGRCGQVAHNLVKEATARSYLDTAHSLITGTPEHVPEWSLHCSDPKCSIFPMTTVLETIKNPGLWQLAVSKEKREEYENNRKKVGIWLLDGLTETWKYLENMKNPETERDSLSICSSNFQSVA